jgi:CubicO group peptidase (beta-lactamase class C family)
MTETSLPRTSAVDEGIEPRAVDAFLSAADAANAGLHSFMVVRHGNVAAEGWWAPYTPEREHMMFSISKSFTSTAIGLAQDDGLLSVDEPILAFFPGQASRAVRKAASQVRVRDLLTMSTGHQTDTFPIMKALPDSDWVQVFFDVPFAFPPGCHFLYNTGATYVLSAALAARTGQAVGEYLRPRLFDPLGIPVRPWATSPAGIPLGGTGLRATTEDIAKLGQLYLQRGVWKGHRLLSETWVDASTSKQVDNSSTAPDWAQGYGYQFWRSRHASYRADGAFGQFAFVLPELDTVVAITAGQKENWRIPDLVWNHLLRGILPDGRAASNDHADELRDHVERLEISTAELADGTHALIGRQLNVAFNRLGISSLQVSRRDSQWTLDLTDETGTHHTLSGDQHGWSAGTTSLWFDDEFATTATATRAGLSPDGAIEFHEQCVETVYSRVWRIEETPEGPVLTVTLRVVGSIEDSEVVRLARP